MSSKSPAFQFYVKDYLTDVLVREMSFQHRGVYIEILCHLWNAEGSLPSDLDRLAIIIGMSARRLRKLWPMIEKCFEIDGEILRNPRLDAEKIKQEKFKAKQKANGLKGGKPKKINATGNPGLSSGETQTEPKGNAKQSFPFASADYLPTGADEIETPDDVAERHAVSVSRLMATLAEASAVLGLPGADILSLPKVRPPHNTPITNPAGVAVNESGIRLLDTTHDKVKGLMAAKRGDAIAADQKRDAQPTSIFDQEARIA